MKEVFEKGKSFFINARDTSTKEFLIYLCINFSFLVNGLLFICMGVLPVIITDSGENPLRVVIGVVFVVIWFTFLPNVSTETKDKIQDHFGWSFLSLMGLFGIVVYWFHFGTRSSFVGWDIIVMLVSVPIFAYAFFLLINLFKLFFLVIKKIVNKIMPEVKNNDRGLMFTLETVTSMFVAISSLVAAFWGVITAVKTIIEKFYD